VTVLVRRGRVLSLVAPIPPATVSFHGTAMVYPAGAAEARPLLEELADLLPTEPRASASIIEVIPEGAFVTYALGVSLAKMRDPAAARTRARSLSRPLVLRSLNCRRTSQTVRSSKGSRPDRQWRARAGHTRATGRYRRDTPGGGAAALLWGRPP
jgi:hypothetical protein